MVLSASEVISVEVYTVEEAATLLHVKPRTIRECIQSGRLGASKVGRSYIITEEDIQAFLMGPARVKPRKPRKDKAGNE